MAEPHFQVLKKIEENLESIVERAFAEFNNQWKQMLAEVKKNEEQLEENLMLGISEEFQVLISNLDSPDFSPDLNEIAEIPVTIVASDEEQRTEGGQKQQEEVLLTLSSESQKLKFTFGECVQGQWEVLILNRNLSPPVFDTGQFNSPIDEKSDFQEQWDSISTDTSQINLYRNVNSNLLGYTEVLDQSTELVVPDDDYGLFAIDILDPSLFVKLFHVTELYHLHDMIDMLIKCGYKKGTTLFGYVYDFRQSNQIDKSMEGLKAKLETAYKASGNRKVNIISHSMGGLLVSCFMSLYPDVFSKFVSKWTCIACPFQGSPGCINDALLTGLQFVEGFESYFFVSKWTMHQLLVECPSIYEMLANPGFSWESPPQVQVWRKKSDDEETCTELVSYGPLDCVTLFHEALKNNELTYNGNKVALPFNTYILKWAARTRQILNAAQLSKGVSFYNIFGTSNDTPFDVRYGTETSPIEDLSEICHTVPEYSYVDGDGTVPAESAKADGFEAVERVGIAGSHRGLLHDETVFSLIQNWLGIEQTQTNKKHPKTTSKVVDDASSKNVS